MSSPPIEISSLSAEKGTVFVVRDDLLKGGTKQRAAVPFINALKEQGVDEVVYASPFSGYAQVAIAISSRSVNVKSTIFVEKDQTQELPTFSFFSRKIANICNLRITKNLADAETEAEDYCRGNHSRLKIPLGLNDERFKKCLRYELTKQWALLCKTVVPERLWVSLGSGTLAEVLHAVISKTTILSCVNVHVLADDHPRIKKIKELSNVEIYSAPEVFIEPALNPPEIPSNLFYDAKVWQFINKKAKHNDVWWNVA